MSNVIKSRQVKTGEKRRLSLEESEAEPEGKEEATSSETDSEETELTEVKETKETILEEARQEAEAIKQSAQEEAEKIKSEAREEAEAEIEKARSEAYEDGFEAGKQEAKQEVKNQFEGFLTGLSQEVNHLEDFVQGEFAELSDELVELAVEISRRIIKAELSIDPGIIKRLVVSALEQVEDDRQVEIRVNPEDLELLEAEKEQLLAANGVVQEIDLIPDRDIELGGCIIETDFGGIEASISAQLAEIEKELLDVSHNE